MEDTPNGSLSIQQLPLEKIYTSPHQMRRHFDSGALKDLARSMKEEGLIQPVTVRKVGGAYELVVGERRFRAARMLQWPTIDARVIDISDEDAAVKGLIENLQRADLSPVEEARGYRQLVDAPYNLTQDAIAQRVGKNQTAIARALSILELPTEIQELMSRGIITETHTRSLRKMSDRSKQVAMARRADREGWTVKELERRVNEALREAGEPTKLREGKSKVPLKDPLGAIWSPILATSGESGVKASAVQYAGMGKWTLTVETQGAVNLRHALGDFFVRLGNTLNGPVPADVLEKKS